MAQTWISFKTSRYFALNTFRRIHELNRTSFLKNHIHQSSKPLLLNQARNLNSKSSSKNYLPIIIGTASVGIGAIAYSLFGKKASVIHEATDDTEDVPFVDEHLQENLELLKEFGPIPYLLIGAGSASFAAYRAIRTHDPTAKVVMIGNEPFFPYMRPPLSKELWFDADLNNAETLSFTRFDGKNRSIFYETPEFYFPVKDMLENKNGGISILRGKKVVQVDPNNRKIILDKGEQLSYEKCLIATGSKPKSLAVLENTDKSIQKHIMLFKNAQDFRKLDKIAKKSKSVLIIGGGFLGSELACGLAKRYGPSGLEVVQIFPETGNVGKILPEYLSLWTSKKVSGQGVTVIPEVNIKSVSKLGDKIELLLSNGKVLKADHIVVAVGSEANTELAKTSGLEVDEKNGGFLVNTEMEARKNLWVAGDASCFYDTQLGRRRVEHHDHAMVSGKLAGENMTGKGRPYWHQSMFWSDLGPEIGFEAIGIVDSSLPTVGVFAKMKPEDSNVTEGKAETKSEVSQSQEISTARSPNLEDDYSKGLIFYLKDNVIVGVVLWNVFAKMQTARQVLGESFDNISEIAKLFELHSSDILSED